MNSLLVTNDSAYKQKYSAYKQESRELLPLKQTSHRMELRMPLLYHYRRGWAAGNVCRKPKVVPAVFYGVSARLCWSPTYAGGHRPRAIRDAYHDLGATIWHMVFGSGRT
jgi:hypothetical protein